MGQAINTAINTISERYQVRECATCNQPLPAPLPRFVKVFPNYYDCEDCKRQQRLQRGKRE